jgi:hypothetical protein
MTQRWNTCFPARKLRYSFAYILICVNGKFLLLAKKQILEINNFCAFKSVSFVKKAADSAETSMPMYQITQPSTP